MDGQAHLSRPQENFHRSRAHLAAPLACNNCIPSLPFSVLTTRTRKKFSLHTALVPLSNWAPAPSPRYSNATLSGTAPWRHHPSLGEHASL